MVTKYSKFEYTQISSRIGFCPTLPLIWVEMIPEQPFPSHLKPGISIALVALLFLSFASAIVWSFHDRFPTIQILFLQNFISLCVVAPYSLRHGLTGLKTSIFPLHLLRDFFGVGSYFLSFLAIRYMNLVDATLLNNTAPFWVPIIGWILRKESIPKHVWWSIIIGFIGMGVILHPTKQIFALGFFYGLFAGICSAIAVIALRMINLKREPMIRSLFYYFSLGSLISFPFALAVWTEPTFFEIIKIIGIGVFTAIGQMFLTVAYRYAAAAYLSPIGYISIVYSGLIAYFAFGQNFGWRSLIGTILIICGGTLTYFFEKKK